MTKQVSKINVYQKQIEFVQDQCDRLIRNSQYNITNRQYLMEKIMQEFAEQNSQYINDTKLLEYINNNTKLLNVQFSGNILTYGKFVHSNGSLGKKPTIILSDIHYICIINRRKRKDKHTNNGFKVKLKWHTLNLNKVGNEEKFTIKYMINNEWIIMDCTPIQCVNNNDLFEVETKNVLEHNIKYSFKIELFITNPIHCTIESNTQTFTHK